MAEDNEFQQRIQQIEGLVHRVESLSDANARQTALELFQLIMELHGAGLDRMMGIAFDAGDTGRAIINRFADDELVASLLLLYGLHPLDLEGRVMAALEKVRPFLRSHGGSVELLGIADGVVRLRLGGGGSSTQALRQAVEEAVYNAAPDVTAIQVEEEASRPAPSTLVQLQIAPSKKADAKPAEKSREEFMVL